MIDDIEKAITNIAKNITADHKCLPHELLHISQTLLNLAHARGIIKEANKTHPSWVV